MARTTSLNFPSLFDVSRNKVSVIKDNQSVVNRSRLLILTEPTELYNNPTFGVGLKQYLFQYNTENTKALIRNRITDQLREHEPCVEADKTSFANGLMFTGNTEDNPVEQEYNKLKMTIGLHTTFGDTISVDINDDQ